MVAMNLAVRKPMSLAEFLEWEDRQELRYEFDGVEPSAMTGGTVAHATIQGNLAVAIGGRLRGKPCRFYGSDLKIRVADNHIRYPDGMVVCSRVDQTAKVVHDPVVIFEVLSPSTAAKDRIVKAREYQATPSVKRYVMLEQERIGATVLVRAQDGWSALILKDDERSTCRKSASRSRSPKSTKALPSRRSRSRTTPAAARHCLIGLLTDRFPDAERLGSPPRGALARPLRPPSRPSTSRSDAL